MLKALRTQVGDTHARCAAPICARTLWCWERTTCS